MWAPLVLVSVLSQVDTSVGTLLLVIPTRDGIVACADKRSHYPGSNITSDGETKIALLSGNVLAAASGVARMSWTSSNKIAGEVQETYNPLQLAAEYFLAHTFEDTETFWRGLLVHFSESLNRSLEDHYEQLWPLLLQLRGDDVFKLILFFFDTAGAPQGVSLWLTINRVDPGYDLHADRLDEVTLVVARPQVIGYGEAWLMLLDTNNPLFDQYRKHGLTRTFALNDPKPASKTSAKDAQRFAESFIKVVSEKVPESHVGPAVDCAVLSRFRLRWLPTLTR